MNQIPPYCPSTPHEVSVLFGTASVAAYLAGEKRRELLGTMGMIQRFRFSSLQELNAFLYGIEVAAGYDDVLAVDDLC